MQGKLLIIDNTTAIMNPWKKALSSHFETSEAVGGIEAVRKIRTEPIDAVIVNISLRQLHGVEAISKIRSYFDKLPIIILYDPRDILDLKQAKAYCVNALLPLPVDFKKLIQEIRQLLPAGEQGETPAGRRTAQSGKGLTGTDKSDHKEDLMIDVEQRYYDGLSAISANNMKEAIDIFQSLICITRIKRESWRRYLEEALFLLGQCHATLGDYEKSNYYYTTFINKAPHNSSLKSALLYLGKNYLELKNNAKAAFYFKKVINTAPVDSFCTQARKLLKTIKHT